MLKEPSSQFNIYIYLNINQNKNHFTVSLIFLFLFSFHTMHVVAHKYTRIEESRAFADLGRYPLLTFNTKIFQL